MPASQIRLVTEGEPSPLREGCSQRDVAAKIISGMTIRVLSDDSIHIGKRLDGRDLTLIVVTLEEGELIGHRHHREVADQYIDLWRWATDILGTSMGGLVLAVIEMSKKVEDTSLTYTGTQAWLYWANSMQGDDRALDSE